MDVKIRAKQTLNWRSYGLLVMILLIISIVVAIPHRKESFSINGILQNGMNVAVAVTMRSSWGWFTPDRISSLQVRINGADVPLNSSAYNGVCPIDLKRKAAIAERDGFPEIIFWGLKGSRLKNVRFHFQNYSFSQVDVASDRDEKTTYFEAPIANPKQIQLQNVTSTNPLIAISTASIKKASLKEIK